MAWSLTGLILLVLAGVLAGSGAIVYKDMKGKVAPRRRGGGA